jgi:hypothetical protein
MKVYLGPYKDYWVSPYTILENFFFWRKDYDAFENEPPKWLTATCEFVYKYIPFKERTQYVKIDKWDTWSMDGTLANIILPMLIQLKATKHGTPIEFAETGGEDYNAQKHFDFYDTNEELNTKAIAEWDIVFDKMIFSFEHIIDDGGWEEEFCTGKFSTTIGIGEPGWQGTRVCDYEAIKKVHAQIQEGLELFGKYYRNLWD